MPKGGAKLGERRGDRKKGTPNKDIHLQITDAATRALLGPMIAKLPAIAAMAYNPLLAQPIMDLCRQNQGLDLASLPLSSRDDDAARVLTIEAFVSATLDKTKIQAILDYTSTLSINERYTQAIIEAARINAQSTEAPAKVVSRNENVSVNTWLQEEDAIDWLFPYRGYRANPGLAARFHKLASLPTGTLGRAYWEQYQSSGYAFPGEPGAVNETVATPHDCTHLLSGYDTTPRGEVLAAAFTSAMHHSWRVEAQILPMLFGWDLGIKITHLAASAITQLDRRQFWHAWARGAAITQDLFAPGWDFWTLAPQSLSELREAFGIPPLQDVETAELNY